MRCTEMGVRGHDLQKVRSTGTQAAQAAQATQATDKQWQEGQWARIDLISV
jgi:hypothetical protein